MPARKHQMLLKLTGLLGFAGAAMLAVPALNQTNFIQSVVAQTTPGVGTTDPTVPGTTTTPGLGIPTDPTAPDATTAPGTTTPDATIPGTTTTPGVGTPTDTDTDNNDIDDNGAADTTQPAGQGVRALW